MVGVRNAQPAAYEIAGAHEVAAACGVATAQEVGATHSPAGACALAGAHEAPQRGVFSSMAGRWQTAVYTATTHISCEHPSAVWETKRSKYVGQVPARAAQLRQVPCKSLHACCRRMTSCSLCALRATMCVTTAVGISKPVGTRFLAH